MVEINVNEEKLILSIKGKYFVKPFEFPWENVTGVEIDSALARDWIRKRDFLAKSVPALNREGVYYEDGNCTFWEIQNPNRTIVIYLQNEPYEKMVVEVENPNLAIEVIENALKNKDSRVDEPDDSTDEVFAEE
jgi:hypothetical protein